MSMGVNVVVIVIVVVTVNVVVDVDVDAIITSFQVFASAPFFLFWTLIKMFCFLQPQTLFVLSQSH